MFYPYPVDAIFTNMASLIQPDSPEIKERIESWPWVLWHLWKDRNNLCFSTPQGDAETTTKKAFQDATAWKIANTNSPPVSQVSLPSRRSNPWNAPPLHYFKCNVDGSWRDKFETSGIGWILRDHNGSGKWFGMKTFPHLRSPLHTEATTLIWTMAVIDNLGFTNVTFESDCKTLFEAIKDPTKWPALDTLTAEILKPRKQLQTTFLLTNRTANAAADMLAKKALSMSLYSANLDCTFPNWLMPILTKDASCIPLNSI